MANPTTYFGWVMPNSADLVTDLPADFAVFGQGVDTSMSQLLGGTTGQVLSKTSGTNMAFTWVTPTDQTPLTTKGDLFTFTTVDARIGVGANDTVLTADSAQATGLKWAAPAAATAAFVGVYAYRGSAFTATGGADSVITMPSEAFDTDAFHSTTTNTGRITIPAGKAGKYQFNFYAYLSSSPGAYGRLRLFLNGANVTNGVEAGTFFAYDDIISYRVGQGSTTLSLSVADYVELVMFGQNNSTVANAFITATYLGA